MTEKGPPGYSQQPYGQQPYPAADMNSNSTYGNSQQPAVAQQPYGQPPYGQQPYPAADMNSNAAKGSYQQPYMQPPYGQQQYGQPQPQQYGQYPQAGQYPPQGQYGFQQQPYAQQANQKNDLATGLCAGLALCCCLDCIFD